MARSSNPAFGSRAFDRIRAQPGAETMTLQGTLLKTGVLLLVAAVSAAMVWSTYFAGNAEAAMGAAMVGVFGGLVFALVTVFVPRVSPWTAPLYAVLEGMALGGISAVMQTQYAGIPMQAVGLTFGTAFAMLAAYRFGVIRATDRFRAVVTSATLGIGVYYLIALATGFFGIRMPLIYDTGMLGIGFSLLVVGVAALNYILDFDFVERAVAAGADRRMEWYGAFGVLVTTIWLYMEILRLLSKLRSRN